MILEWVSSFTSCSQLIGHFREESFQAITCTGNVNSKQTAENAPKHKEYKLAIGQKNIQKPFTKPKSAGPIAASILVKLLICVCL